MITLRPCIHRTTPLYLRLPSFSICLGRVQLTPVFCFIALGCLAVLRLGLDVSFAHIAFRLTLLYAKVVLFARTSERKCRQTQVSSALWSAICQKDFYTVAVVTTKHINERYPLRMKQSTHHCIQVRLGVLAARCASCFAWHYSSAHLCNPPEALSWKEIGLPPRWICFTRHL